jgi:hypothetical protein
MADKVVVYTFLVTVTTSVAVTEDDPDFYTEAFLTSPEGLKHALDTMAKCVEHHSESEVVLQSHVVREE